MSLNSFIDRVNDNWPRGVPATAADDWRRMLSRFSDEQLDSIFDRLLANEHYTPKISDVFKAAKYHGFTDREPVGETKTKGDIWEPTECPDCLGGGLIRVLCEVVDRLTFQRLPQLANPLYEPRPEDTGHLSTWVHRCSCPQGSRDTMPAVLQLYPVWDKSKLTYPVSM